MRIEAEPADALYDRALTTLRLVDFPASRGIAVYATARDDLGHQWKSSAEFTTDSRGQVDLALTAPRGGTYRVADAMGLFWSMQLDPAIEARGPFSKTNPDPVVVTITSELDGVPVASIELTRRFLAERIVRDDIGDSSLVGAFYHHASEPRPGVLLLGGSGGGMSIEHPALLASQGFTVLSLAYFAMPGLPQDLTDIPLEYFERAIAWMRKHPAVKPGPLAVIGASRGGELALLLGATFPEISAVVGYVPSGVGWAGIKTTGDGPPGASWTYRENPIPFVRSVPTDFSVWNKKPVALTAMFLSQMTDAAELDYAAIAVEKINGPVLMFSGTDDQMWPSLNLADLAVQRLIAKNFKHPYEHISYACAGHFIRYPYCPVIDEIFHPVVKTAMALGGSPESNHIANLDSWQKCLTFLRRHLGGTGAAN